MRRAVPLKIDRLDLDLPQRHGQLRAGGENVHLVLVALAGECQQSRGDGARKAAQTRLRVGEPRPCETPAASSGCRTGCARATSGQIEEGGQQRPVHRSHGGPDRGTISAEHRCSPPSATRGASCAPDVLERENLVRPLSCASSNNLPVECAFESAVLLELDVSITPL